MLRELKCSLCKNEKSCAVMGIGEPAIEKCGMFNLKDPLPRTNADRIRSYTDEELAEFISGKGRTFGEEYEGYMSALDWLKQEVDNG